MLHNDNVKSHKITIIILTPVSMSMILSMASLGLLRTKFTIWRSSLKTEVSKCDSPLREATNEAEFVNFHKEAHYGLNNVYIHENQNI